MYAIPRYLLKIFFANKESCNDHNLDGDICCDCGCRSFRIKMFANTEEKSSPNISEYKDDWAFVLKILCENCKKEWLLFDMSQHGYNGFVCHDGITVPDTELKEYTCPSCDEDLFEFHVGIEVEDKEQFIEEIVQEYPDLFSEEDYVDAFDWINIDLKCTSCKREIERWIDLETA